MLDLRTMFSYTLNDKQSVTLCLTFRPFKRCLNGVKQSKRFCTITIKYTYLCR
jgi:hypothetical protein